MRRLEPKVCSALAVVLCLLTLSAAVGAQPVVIQHVEAVNRDGEAIRKQQVLAFNEKYGDQVYIDYQPIAFADLLEKLPVMIAADVMPDIVLIPNELWHLVTSRIALDLMPYITRDGIDLSGMVPGTVETAMEGDALLALSTASWVPLTEMVGYNMTMLAEAGIAFPDVNWTWEDLVNLDKRLTQDVDGDGTIDRMGTDLGRHLVGAWGLPFLAALHAHGGAVIASDLSRSIIDSEASRYVFPLLKETTDNFRAHVNDVGWDWYPIVARRAAITLGYSGDVLQAVSHLPGEIGTQVLPRGPEGHPYFRNPKPPTPGWSFIIARGTPHPEEAWAWLRFITFDPDAIAALDPLGLATPPAIPYHPNIDVAREIFSPDFRDHVFPTLMAASELTQAKVIDPFGSLQGPLMDALKPLVSSYFTENMTLPAFLENADRVINQVIQDNPDLVARQREALGL